MSTPPDHADLQQTSFRFDKRLFGQFKNKLTEREEKMAPTLEALMRAYVRDPSIIDETPQDRIDVERPVDLQRAFVRWVPAVVIIKDLEGHVVYANEGFLDLVQQEDVIGLRAHDYLDGATADQISRCDARVRRERLPLLCAEHITIRELGEVHKRITIRFPICAGPRLVFAGTLGFDVDSVSLARFLDPDAQDVQRARRFPSSPGRRESRRRAFAQCLH